MDCQTRKFKLISGDLIPMIGYGTFEITGARMILEVLDYALAAGYRSIDTAAAYQNEKDIGVALKDLLPKHHLKREEIFLTSKLPPTHHGDKANLALQRSLTNLNTEYLDLYLIHWPGQQGAPQKGSQNRRLRSKTWEILVGAQEAGVVRNIGVSNYTVRHLNELLENNFGINPAVNQVEWHPHCHQPDLKELCDKHGILVQAYSSLGGPGNQSLTGDSTVVTIANKLKRHPAQILLRWALQNNVGIIPKASSKKHIESNMNLNFQISGPDMDTLSHLPQRRYAWDPTDVD